MSRPSRLQFAGAIYRIVTRGDGRRAIFHGDGHYTNVTLAQLSDRFGQRHPDSSANLARRAKKREEESAFDRPPSFTSRIATGNEHRKPSRTLATARR